MRCWGWKAIPWSRILSAFHQIADNNNFLIFIIFLDHSVCHHFSLLESLIRVLVLVWTLLKSFMLFFPTDWVRCVHHTIRSSFLYVHNIQYFFLLSRIDSWRWTLKFKLFSLKGNSNFLLVHLNYNCCYTMDLAISHHPIWDLHIISWYLYFSLSHRSRTSQFEYIKVEVSVSHMHLQQMKIRNVHR